MINVTMTKCQLNIDDLIEYESSKAKWKRDSAPSFPKRANKASTDPDRSHRNMVHARIGLSVDSRGPK